MNRQDFPRFLNLKTTQANYQIPESMFKEVKSIAAEVGSGRMPSYLILAALLAKGMGYPLEDIGLEDIEPALTEGCEAVLAARNARAAKRKRDLLARSIT